MLFVTGEMLMDEEQAARWTAVLDGLRALEAEADAPFLFHGTSSLRASMILHEGFDPERTWVPLPLEDGTLGGTNPCVFWTPRLEVALDRALKPCPSLEGMPVILSARLDDVVASGVPVPDYCAWEIDHHCSPGRLPRDWMESLDMLGAIAVVDCRHVRGLVAHAAVPLDFRPDEDAVREAYAELLSTSRSGRAMS